MARSIKDQLGIFEVGYFDVFRVHMDRTIAQDLHQRQHGLAVVDVRTEIVNPRVDERARAGDEDGVVGVSMIGMALWTLRPDTLEEGSTRVRRTSAFVATIVAFFIAEIGDKTQIATVALAAAYSSLAAVVAGTTIGMLIANAPVVFLGKAFSERLPLKAINYVASGLFLILGTVFIIRALHQAS